MPAIYHLLDEQEVFSERNGGAISRWAANVLRSGSEVVICPSYDSSWGFPEERIYVLPKWNLTDPIHPVLYRLPWVLQKTAYLQVFGTLLQKLRRDDILYIHNRPECASALATVAEKHGFKLVLHMHNSHLTIANKGQLRALRKTPIVCCSEFIRNEIHAKLPNFFERTYVVYNGADHHKFQRRHDSGNSIPQVIWTGRIVPYKGVHILVEAMSLLEAKRVAVACKIVGGHNFGDGKTTRYIAKLKNTRPSNTEFTGYLAGNDLATHLQRADIFCCPSTWNDPFPLAPLEAMATGLPVVASDRGGLPEMLSHGGGLLVPANDVQALADALQMLAENKHYRKKLAEKAYSAFREHFLWTNVRSQYEHVLRDITAGSPPLGKVVASSHSASGT